VADCCLILKRKLSCIIVSLRLQVQGLHLLRACPVSTPANRIIIVSLSIRSHSRGPLGTIAIHSWDSHTLTRLWPVLVDCLVVLASLHVILPTKSSSSCFQFVPTPEDHLAPLPFTPGIRILSHGFGRSLLIVSLSRHLFTWLVLSVLLTPTDS
jgi:hypothetical protein